MLLEIGSPLQLLLKAPPPAPGAHVKLESIKTLKQHTQPVNE